MPEAFKEGYLAGWRLVRGAGETPDIPALSASIGRAAYLAGLARGLRDAKALSLAETRRGRGEEIGPRDNREVAAFGAPPRQRICIIWCIGIMLWFRLAMIHSEPPMTSDDDQHAEGQRQHVVGVVRRRGDVQEEHQVHAHLGDGQHDERDRNRRLPRPGRCPARQNETR